MQVAFNAWRREPRPCTHACSRMGHGERFDPRDAASREPRFRGHLQRMQNVPVPPLAILGAARSSLRLRRPQPVYCRRVERRPHDPQVRRLREAMGIRGSRCGQPLRLRGGAIDRSEVLARRLRSHRSAERRGASRRLPRRAAHRLGVGPSRPPRAQPGEDARRCRRVARGGTSMRDGLPRSIARRVTAAPAAPRLRDSIRACGTVNGRGRRVTPKS
jgi:hypothetical protein